MKIIGLTGRASVGKDTIADRLVSHYGYTKYSFAAPLKAMLKVIGVDCNDRAKKELPHPVFGVSPRVMAQTLGTEWMRDCVSEDGWLLLAENFIQTTRELNRYEDVPSVKGIVFSDVRFPNEADMIRECGTLIHITRKVEAVAAHESENGIEFDDVDRWLMNDRTIEIAYRRIGDILADL